MSVDLVYYASKGNLDKIKQCMHSGICVDAHGGKGETALFHASRNGFRRCVQYLLKKGADPNCCSELGFTPVNAACFGNHVTSLALLVQHGGLINQLVPGGRETPLASAARHRSKRCLQFMNLVLKDALTEHGENLLELNLTGRLAHSLHKHKPLCMNPGLSARVPCIEPEELKIPQGESHRETGPDWLLQSAIWRGTPVSVKLLENAGEKKYDKHLLKEIDILSQLRHPRLAILMAANVGPATGHICLVLEPFELGSLHYVLYETQLKMNLAERVEILLDIAEGMIFLHNLKLLHCFLNSYSVLLSERFRAKIGNLEHAQECGSARAPVNGCEMQTRWMAPEQLLAEPANNAADVYSFGATMWECLARTVPWDWIERNSIQHVLCDLGQSLPVPQTWPNYIQTIVWKCLDKPGLRPNFCSVYEQIYCIKNRGWDVGSEDLDNIFTHWLKNHKYTRHSQRKSIIIEKQTITQTKKDVIDEIIEEKYVPYRRHSSMGEKTVDEALMNILKISDSHYEKKQEKKDATKYGNVIAAQMSAVRRMRAHAQPYNRHRWAKEVTLARALEGDMNRLQKMVEIKKFGKDKKRKPLLTKSEFRQLRMKPESIERVQSIAQKFEKKIWARHLDRLIDTFQTDARRKSAIDTQIHLFKSRSNLVKINEEALDSEKSEVGKSEIVETKPYSSSSEEIIVDEPECKLSEVLESSDGKMKRVDMGEKRATHLTKVASFISSESDPQVRMLVPRSKSLSDICREKVLWAEALPWKQMAQQEGMDALTSSLEESGLPEDALIRSAPAISSSASKLRKAQYVTQVASRMHPRKSISYNGGSRTTSQESATAHASFLVPDLLTPVEVAPSFKASKKASENGETLKLLEDFSSWLDDVMSNDSDEEDSEEPGFRQDRFETDEYTSRGVLFDNTAVTSPIIPCSDGALDYEPIIRPSKGNQSLLSGPTSEFPISRGEQRGRWISKIKEPNNILQAVTGERNKTDKRRPRKSKSLVSFKNEDIKVYPEEALKSLQQCIKCPKDFSFEQTLPVDTNGHVSVELKVTVRRKESLQHVRKKSL